MPDEYGSFTPNNLEELKTCWIVSGGNMVVSYSPNQIDAYIINFNAVFSVFGILPFGGNPRGRVWVSVYGRGASHFELGIMHWEYISEKLHVDELCARSIAIILEVLEKPKGESDDR